MKYQEEKFINALLFFGKNTDPEIFGRKKLWKLLFLIDTEHFKEHCRPVLGDNYRLRQYGPVPESSYIIFMDTFREGVKTNLTEAARTISIPVGDYSLEKIVPLQDPDLEVFSDSELKIMKRIAKKYYSKRGGEIEKEVKNSPIIKKVKHYGVIDFKKFLKDKNKRKYVEYWEQEDKILEGALS